MHGNTAHLVSRLSLSQVMHVLSASNSFQYNLQYFYEIFCILNKICTSSLIQLVLVNLVKCLVFFLAGTLTSVSLTVTHFTPLAVDSLLDALLDGELLNDTSMCLVKSTCTFHTFSVICNHCNNLEISV